MIQDHALKTRLYTHPCFLRHDTGPGHPERPDRLRALLDLFAEPPFNGLPVIQAPEADPEWICRAHDEAYFMAIEEAIPSRGLARIDADTVVSPGSGEAALRAAGAVCRAVDDVLGGEADRAFCAVRPPGHHAFPGHAEGFCLFNNIFIGALHAREAHGLSRVAILDFDVHHGNGSDAMARRHDDIFYGSTHQWPLYPGTGQPRDDIPGRICNVTLAAGDDGTAFRRAWAETILPQLDDFAPELVMISAGFDAHKDDPLAQIALTAEDFAWITERLAETAVNHGKGRIVSVLEGGYDIAALKESAASHLRALAAL